MNNITKFMERAKAYIDASKPAPDAAVERYIDVIVQQSCADCLVRASCVLHDSDGVRYPCAYKFTRWALDDSDPCTSDTIVAPTPERQSTDMVDHPAHYNIGTIEVITVIEDWKLGFNLGNAVKYIARAGHKSADPKEDLSKALWYLRREIGEVGRLNKGKAEWVSTRVGMVYCPYCGYYETHKTPYCAYCGSEMNDK